VERVVVKPVGENGAIVMVVSTPTSTASLMPTHTSWFKTVDGPPRRDLLATFELRHLAGGGG
jgi:hypothetical protein